MIIFLTFAIIVGKRNNKVRMCSSKKKSFLWSECGLNLDCYSEFLVPFFVFFFLQKKECFTEHGILETLTCTKEHRGRARQAAPNCLRSQLPFMAEAACKNAGVSDNWLIHLMKKKKTQTNSNFITSTLPPPLLSLGLQNQPSKLLAVNI